MKKEKLQRRPSYQMALDLLLDASTITLDDLIAERNKHKK